MSFKKFLISITSSIGSPLKVVLLSMIIVISECSTFSNEKFIGYGTVKVEKKLGGVSYKPKSPEGVAIDTTSGVVIGAGTGFITGLVGGTAGTVILFPPAAIAAPVVGMLYGTIGLVGGGIAGGFIGHHLGENGGYVYEINKKGKGVYYLFVRPSNKDISPLKINQNLQQHIQVGNKVKIYKDYKFYFYPLGYHIETLKSHKA